jgi:hypothetical protein
MAAIEGKRKPIAVARGDHSADIQDRQGAVLAIETAKRSKNQERLHLTSEALAI